jgi:thioredoxin-related protein
MKKLALFLIPFTIFTSTGWLTNYNEAKKTAVEKHEFLLVNFSGSDWCVQCIRLRNDIFGSNAFKKYADSNLVLLNVDFPRLKKNRLSLGLEKQNNELAGKFNPDGLFPYTLLISPDDKIIKVWDGYPNEKPDEFVQEIKKACNASK